VRKIGPQARTAGLLDNRGHRKLLGRTHYLEPTSRNGRARAKRLVREVAAIRSGPRLPFASINPPHLPSAQNTRSANPPLPRVTSIRPRTVGGQHTGSRFSSEGLWKSPAAHPRVLAMTRIGSTSAWIKAAGVEATSPNTPVTQRWERLTSAHTPVYSSRGSIQV
jgi:hypothetical protein